MTDFLCSNMQEEDINRMSELALAHVGDAVYELMTRTMLCEEGFSTVQELHSKTVSLVNAGAQAEAFKVIQPFLTEEELKIYKRGRNARVYSVPKNASVADYHSATGIEVLFGRLYLEGRTGRINELYKLIKEALYVT